MARVTVEDCVLKVPNRFDLVMLAAQRARDISAGSPLTVERDDDKNPVIALREIADDTVSVDTLGDSLIESMQKHVEIDEPEEEQPDFEMAMVAMGAESLEEPAVTADALAGTEDDELAATEDGSIEEEGVAEEGAPEGNLAEEGDSEEI